MAYGARALRSRSFRSSQRTGKPSTGGFQPHGEGKQASLQGGGTGRCDTSSLYHPQQGTGEPDAVKVARPVRRGAGGKGGLTDLARGLPYLLRRCAP